MTFEKELEEMWLESVVVPQIVHSGKLMDNDSTQVTNFNLNSIEIEPIGADEGFSLAIYYTAKIELTLNGKMHKTLNLVVKKTPELTEEMFNAIKFPAMFSNEINGYAIVLPALTNFNKKIINAPKFYYGDLQKCSAAIVLANFHSIGYRMSKNRTNLSLEHTIQAMKYLGTFHGASFAMKNMEYDHFKAMADCLKEAVYDAPDIHEDWNHLLKISVKRVVTVTQRYHPEIPRDFLQELELLIADNYLYGKQRIKPVEPLATICHGDFLRNNVSYKYDGTSDHPVDIMMFDLQTMRYCSPMIDVSVFLSISVYNEVRSKHFDEIFSVYCEQLNLTFMKHTKGTSPDYLSRGSLLKEYARFLPYSIAAAASFLMTLVEPSQNSSEEAQQTLEQIEEDTMRRGGDIVDRELAHQVKEMYDLSLGLKVNIGDGIVLGQSVIRRN